MKLHLGGLDICVIIVLVLVGIVAHNWYNVHPTREEYKVLQQETTEAKQADPKSMGGGGASSKKGGK